MSKRTILISFSLILLLSGCQLQPIRSNPPAPPTNGIYKSVDNGSTWQYLTDPASGTGLPIDNTVVMVPDPKVHTVLFWGSETVGIFRSWNSGNYWQQINTGLPATGYARIERIVFDPQDTNTIYLVGNFDGLGRIVRGINGGGQWKRLYSDLLNNTSVTAIIVHPKDSKTLFATSTSRAFLKSTDAGETWQALHWFQGNPVNLAIHPNNPDVFFVFDQSAGLMRSSDGGRTWIKAMPDTMDVKLNTFAISPLNPDSIYVASKDGAYFSTDAGVTWNILSTYLPVEHPDLKAMAFHPADPDILYFSSRDTLYITYNHGTSWDIKKLKIPQTITQIVVDAIDPDIIYVGVGT
ncbi:hypothetical protein AUK40_06440 [Candidatus Wirthbacteria bacterium CG2_30_54_11]|uniref:Sortilin N-terminal domain-containing protein n=1 Tax=Candidatus Wirthbacteria bacterium CG2_30_54_11 TaxID=1817892 RepID=A0A1J5IRU4_9BACT|nr:MAG: hypothetical protein AUK40_06440 [Candidatus Wirthbacteria bacterium CG2_30_54_11]